MIVKQETQQDSVKTLTNDCWPHCRAQEGRRAARDLSPRPLDHWYGTWGESGYQCLHRKSHGRAAGVDAGVDAGVAMAAAAAVVVVVGATRATAVVIDLILQ